MDSKDLEVKELRGYNGEIGVSPFPKTHVEASVQRGFATVAQKDSLIPLAVLIGNANIPTGSIVYVAGDACKQPFSNKVYEIEGKRVIILPEIFVKFVRG